jgi:methyl-accepting chemotaxis protein
MSDGLVIAKTLLSLAAAAMCVSVSVLAIEATRSLRTGQAQVTGLVSKLNLELDEAHRLTLEAGLTAMEARKASVKESAYLDEWHKQIGVTFHGINDVLGSLRTTSDTTAQSEQHVAGAATETIQAAQQTVKAAQPALDNLAGELADLRVATKDLDARIADPNIGKTVANFQVTSDNAAVISTEGRQVVEKYALPSKKKLGFWSSIWATAQVVHKVSPPLF